MFDKLRNKIIIVTMSVATAVLVVAGVFIMLFSATKRPEPKPYLELDYNMPSPALYDDQELKDYIQTDREEGSARLLVALFCVGGIIEVIVFISIYSLSQRIVEPVKKSYDKQKIFIANASHELKTPLAVIEANVEALDVDENNKKWKSNIENEVTHANKLVLDLLQLAKMDAGEIGKNPSEQVNLGAIINEHVEIFKPKFSGKISFDAKNKNAEYILPKQDFLQVLDILLDNATKYGDKKILITLNQNELAIMNDGATIEKKDLEKIFDRFYQTDKTKEGSGLGLAIAKSICKQNKWQIFCESNNKNTKFTVAF